MRKYVHNEIHPSVIYKSSREEGDIMLLKTATIIPPDGRLVFPVRRDMEQITVVITDSAGNELIKMPIERPLNLRGGRIVRTSWDGRFIGWKGSGKGKWYRANPARANYFYTVVGEPKTELPLPEFELPSELPVPPEITEDGVTGIGIPGWMIIAIALAGVFLFMKR